MIDKSIPDIYSLIQELAWHFGNRGFNGECCRDLSLVEFMALKRICGNQNLTVQELGNALYFSKSGATRIVDRLEVKEYIKREQSARDGRICCVIPTARSLEVIESVMEQYTAYLGEILADFDSDTLDQIRNTLEVLVKSIQKQGGRDNEEN